MKTSSQSHSLRGFSLIEVTMAIGIVAFAFIALFALLPGGMGTFRQAMETSVCVQIAQRVINDAQQTAFDTLIDADGLPPLTDSNAGFTFRAPTVAKAQTRFFDDQGDEVIVSEEEASDPSKLDPAKRLKISYWVNTRVLPHVTLPGTTPHPSDSLAQITVQVAFNPSGAPIPMKTGTPDDEKVPDRNLYQKTAGVSVLTYSSLIARSL